MIIKFWLCCCFKCFQWKKGQYCLFWIMSQMLSYEEAFTKWQLIHFTGTFKRSMITESQNEVGRYLLRSSSSDLLLKQGHLELFPRTMSRQFLSVPQDGDSTASLGTLCQCSGILTVKICLLIFRGNLLCFSVCPLTLILSQA